MARSRSIKPGFFRDRKLLDLPPLTRLLFAGLWTVADREGRLEDDPAQIRLDVLPRDKGDIHKMLQALADANFILRYQHGSSQYIQIRTWKKHQNPHVKEPASTIPPPEQYGLSLVQAPDLPGNSGAKTPSSLNPLPLTSSLNPGRRAQAFGEWPLTGAAIQVFFPSVDFKLVSKIATEATQVFLEVPAPKIEMGDAVLAAAVAAAHQSNQKSAGLFLSTVPPLIRLWAESGIRSRASPDREPDPISDVARWRAEKAAAEARGEEY